MLPITASLLLAAASYVQCNVELTQPSSMVIKPGDSLTVTCIICDEIRLDQSPAQVKRPGQSVKISCKMSGFDMTLHFIHWIRQKPGEALEWIGRMNAGSNDAIYAESLKEQFTLTEDVPSSTQFLEAKSLTAEDTAVYYCAREPQ
ncbi:hypothetical protein ACEWY4_003180 [Coilia grayii]|uniref:Ig-like domain-containing protein n=1 Tax=Coilia grayii TaxID=363190 RepID=A0ABD1KQK8_9TELE